MQEADEEPAVHLAEVPKAGRPERAPKQKTKRCTKRPRDEDYYLEVPGDGSPLNDKCLSQWMEQTLCHNKVDDPMPWNSLVGAIVRHRENKDDRGAFCLRRQFAIVNTTAQHVASAGEQGTHWVAVAFDGRLLDTPAFSVYAWDPMSSDRLLRPFLRRCHENDIKVRTQSSGTKKMGGHVAIVPSHSLAFWPVLTVMSSWVRLPYHPWNMALLRRSNQC